MLNKLIKKYNAHTPEKAQKIGRVFLRIGIVISGSMTLMNHTYFALIAAICAIIGDTIMDFYDDEKDNPKLSSNLDKES